MADTVVIARSVQEVHALRREWESLPIDHPHADLDFFLEVVDERDEVVRPHAVLAIDEGRVVGIAAMRLETITLDTTFGYRTVYRPRVRALTLVPGGYATVEPPAPHALARALLESLRAGEADVLSLPSMRLDTELLSELRRSVGPLRRSHFAEVRTHRRLRLPSTFDEFLASRKRKVRAGVRYDSKRLEERLGERLRIERLDSPQDFERIFRDIVRVAELTYQRGLGASFADTSERRRLMRLYLDRGWFRAWVLYDETKPIAFWQGAVYRRVYHSGTTGYDPAYGRDRVGIYLLMRVVADLCNDSDVDILDFGFGDAEYKRHFSDEAWSESDVVIYAPTAHALLVNAGRTALMGTATQARRVLDRFGLVDRVKRRWRRRRAG